MHQIVTIIAKYFVVLPVMALGYAYVTLDKKRRLNMVALLAISTVLTILLVKLATTLHQDPRPFVRDGATPYFVSSTDNGFPSDHTAFSALIAFVVVQYRRKLGIVLAGISLSIGTARVVAGVHHAQDIIGGFVIAAIGVGLATLIVKRLETGGLKPEHNASGK